MASNVLTSLDDAGDYAVGGIAGSATPSVIEIFGTVGLDFAFVDLEHGGFSPWNSRPLEHLARAAELSGVELVVRLPSGEPGAHPPLVRKVVDTGVRNLLIPRVESVDEVAAAIDAAHFHPSDDGRGQRGLGAGRTSRWGPGLRRDDYLEDEDAAVQVGVMLENERILAELDDLLALPDLGFAFVGTADLSHALGHPLEFDHPAVAEAVEAIEAAVADSSVALGGVYVDDVDAMVERGYQLLVLGSDYGAVYDHFGEELAALDR